MSSVTTKLSKSYSAHGKTFNSVTIREPRYSEMYQDGLGRPQELQPGPNGKPIVITYHSTVDAYLQKLIVEPGYDCISELSVLDAMELEITICDFFREQKVSKNSQTS
jgi:hypothetical protein